MTCHKAWSKAFAACFALWLIACGPAPEGAVRTPGSGVSLFANAPSVQWRLPNRLREISGLAFTADGRLFAHDDERAVIYQLDIVRGAIIKSFDVGDRAERGDFEDIAITPEGEFWLMSSQGKLLRFREGEDGGHVDYERFDTGLSHICELEGLAYLASEQSLILACKAHQARDMRHTIALYIWPEAGNQPAALWRTLPEAEITAAAGVREFHPSAVKFDAATGRILLLSSRDAAMAELSPAGQLIAARRFGAEHPQAEGLEVAPDGTLIISDEGNGGPARVAVYGRLQ